MKKLIVGLIAVLMLAAALLVAYHNNTAAPRPDDVEPIEATGDVEDAAAAILQDAEAEAAIAGEADGDADLVTQKPAANTRTEEAYDDKGL